MFNPIVKERLQKTMAYFSASVVGTGAAAFMLQNSRVAMMNPWLLLGLSFGTMIGSMMCDYETNWTMKNALYAGFIGTMGVSLVPLLHMYAMPIIFDAMMATGVTVGSLGVVAYNAPSEQFLNWGGPLSIGLGGMLGVSLLSIFYPSSPALYNIYMYGGLLLFSAFVLYDTQAILHKAKTQQKFDPISNSIHIYMDSLNIFIRFVQIFGNSKK